MKLLTLNTHSLAEKNYIFKREKFEKEILQFRPDVMALQEVNQSRNQKDIFVPEKGTVPGKIPLREDNHAAVVANNLAKAGLSYYWIWFPFKIGYNRYDEGIAVFSRRPFSQWEIIRLSESGSYYDYRTRYALGICVDGIWYYSVHTGRWHDREEHFERQWSRLAAGVEGKDNVWLLGDFNSPAEEPGTGYDRMREDGWQDAFLMAEKRRGNTTVLGAIDGWADKEESMRIDYIWSNYPAAILRAETVFDGKKGGVISDHYGILVETKSDKNV